MKSILLQHGFNNLMLLDAKLLAESQMSVIPMKYGPFVFAYSKNFLFLLEHTLSDLRHLNKIIRKVTKLLISITDSRVYRNVFLFSKKNI